MYKLYTYATFLLLCSCWPSFGEPTTPEPEPVDHMALALAATASIHLEANGRSHCSGVFWGAYVITAAHCADDEETIFVGRVDSVDHTKFGVSYMDSGADLAVLVPLEPFAPPRSVELSPEMPRLGDRIITIGHPSGLMYSVQTGIVSFIERVGGMTPDQRWMQISAPTYRGNSGGPVLNRYGELVGIVSFTGTHGGGPSLLVGAVPLSVLREALAEYGEEEETE